MMARVPLISRDIRTRSLSEVAFVSKEVPALWVSGRLDDSFSFLRRAQAISKVKAVKFLISNFEIIRFTASCKHRTVYLSPCSPSAHTLGNYGTIVKPGYRRGCAVCVSFCCFSTCVDPCMHHPSLHRTIPSPQRSPWYSPSESDPHLSVPKPWWPLICSVP